MNNLDKKHGRVDSFAYYGFFAFSLQPPGTGDSLMRKTAQDVDNSSPLASLPSYRTVLDHTNTPFPPGTSIHQCCSTLATREGRMTTTATATSSQQSESYCSCTTTTALLEQDVEASTTTAVSSCLIPGMLLDDRLQLEQQARQRRRRVKGAGSSSSASRNSSIISTWKTARNTRPPRPDRQHRQQQRQRQHHHHPNKPPSATQRAGLFMLFAALLTLWHYMRTVWWTHGRLAARHARFLQQEQRHDGMHLHHHDYPGTGRMIRRAAPGNIHLDESFQNHQVEEAQNHPQRPAHPLRVQNAKNSNEKRYGADDEQRQRGRIQQHQQQQDDDDEGEKSTSRNESRTQQQQHQQTKKMNLSKLSTHALQALFVKEQQQHQQQIGIVDHTTAAALASPDDSIVPDILMTWLDQVNRDIVNNVHGGIRWVLPIPLPPLSPDPAVTSLIDEERGDKDNKKKLKKNKKQPRIFLDVLREQKKTHFAWQEEWSKMKARAQTRPKVVDSALADVARYLAAHQPVVDYTSAQKYRYPPLLEEPRQEAGVYPQLTTLASIMEHWDQDEDYDGIITETLMHFNYSNPSEMEMARQYRIVELPFKLTNVPELIAANQKWTDEYLSQQFDNDDDNVQMRDKSNAQESPNLYFAYYNPSKWQVETMGLAPVRTNDWTFATWSEHAKYADAVQLSPDQPHFYWQAGIGPEERFLNPAVQNQSFITRDLPSWSSTTPNFITFEPESQKGIQCRFGERSVVAATHYDAGRNMVGMITGAKRYILSPPNSCHNLGIVTSRTSPIFRHSLLNFGHLKYIRGDKNNKNNNGDKMTKEDNQMSQEEHAWLERASQAQAVETVLKAGEVLYIPSFWFHYIISLQKSAQCNVRSGIGHIDGTTRSQFGGEADVLQGEC